MAETALGPQLRLQLASWPPSQVTAPHHLEGDNNLRGGLVVRSKGDHVGQGSGVDPTCHRRLMSQSLWEDRLSSEVSPALPEP